MGRPQWQCAEDDPTEGESVDWRFFELVGVLDGFWNGAAGGHLLFILWSGYKNREDWSAKGRDRANGLAVCRLEIRDLKNTDFPTQPATHLSVIGECVW